MPMACAPSVEKVRFFFLRWQGNKNQKLSLGCQAVHKITEQKCKKCFCMQKLDPDYHRSLRAFVQEVKQQPGFRPLFVVCLAGRDNSRTSKDICLIAATP